MGLWYGTGYGSIFIGSGWLLIKTFICGMLAVEARESSVGPRPFAALFTNKSAQSGSSTRVTSVLLAGAGDSPRLWR